MDEKTIDLSDLKDFCKLTPVRCANFSEAAAVCLEKQGHAPVVELIIRGDIESVVNLKWNKLNPHVFDSWTNLEETVEDAAYAIAILTIWKTTPYIVLRQSEKGSGVDFWCGEKQDGYPFQNKIRLEVSGILRGSMGRINSRLKEKIVRARDSEADLEPFIVIIAEFSRPLVKLIKNA